MPSERKKKTTFCNNLRPMKSKSISRMSTRLRRQKVLKMLAVMEPQETSLETANSHSQEFLSTGRTGRRNALPDILSEHAIVSSGDLPARLQSLTTNEGASTSACNSSEASTAPHEPTNKDS